MAFLDGAYAHLQVYIPLEKKSLNAYVVDWSLLKPKLLFRPRSSMMMRPHLAEQSQVPLWNMDPRRGMLGGPHHQQPGGPGHPHAHHDMSSLMRVRRGGNGALRGRGDAVGGLKMDATGGGGMETIDRGFFFLKL